MKERGRENGWVGEREGGRMGGWVKGREDGRMGGRVGGREEEEKEEGNQERGGGWENHLLQQYNPEIIF